MRVASTPSTTSSTAWVGGDAFSAGIIYGLLTCQGLQESVDFPAAASCLKHAIHGDFNLVSFDEVVALMEGDA